MDHAAHQTRHDSVAPRPRVLLMEDDPLVREVNARSLAHLGYDVVSCRDGAAAVETFRQAVARGEPFALLALDLEVVGGAGGLETLGAIRAIDRSVPAIVWTGNVLAPAFRDPRGHGFAGRLSKPTSLSECAAELSRVLDSSGALGSG